MRKRDIKKILFLICFWVACSIFIVFYDAAILGFKSEVEGEHYSFLRVLVSAVLVTIVGATLLGTLEVFLLNKMLRRKPFGMTLILKTIVYLMFILIFLTTAILYNYSSEIGKPIFSIDVFDLYLEVFLSARVVMQIVYWGIACMLALFILQVSEKFGQGVLINFLLGKYHRPKEEERIFMFLDLKSSTTYAEKLGHLKYSQLIQDCFYDLTDVVSTHEAKIYQYVGDEVVLSWEIDEGMRRGNCVETFFAYDNFLESKRDYHTKKYGMVPEFKAGLNMGNVTVAEVGELKKELAYHGDVLNTAARIQSTCNEYQKRISVSEKIKKFLEKQSNYLFDFLGNVVLKGKK
jgi:adenylate cyclase